MEKNNETKSRIEKHLDYREEEANASIVKFKENLEKNPLYAFEWSADAIEAAAVLEVVRFSRLVLERGGVEAVRESANREVMTRASGVTNRSTSTASNSLNDNRLVAWARLVEDLESLVR